MILTLVCGTTFQTTLSSYSWSLVTLFLSTFLALLAISLNYWFTPGGFAWRNYHKEQTKKLPGPMGWPILGTLPEMGSLAHRKLAAMATSLNSKRLMCLSLGTNRVVISSHPETAREILCGSSFSDRPVKESARVLMFERAIGFAPYGTYWRHLHEERDGGKRCGEVRGILNEGSLSNVLESVFGTTNNSGMRSETKEVLGDMVKEGYELIAEFNWGDYFPFKFLDFHGVKRRCHKLAAKVNTVVGQIVEERKRSGSLLDKMIFLALCCRCLKKRLGDSDVVAILWVRNDISGNRHGCYTPRMDYGHDGDTPRRTNESPPRLTRPLLSWARLAIHDVHVDKVLVPAGTTAMVNMWAITHDSSVWEDPWAFKPERFMKEDVSIMGSDMRLAPFGAGRRVCPGKAMGLATVHLWLAQLLHHFIWVPVQPVDLSECLKLSLE
ncbi:Cytochrome P450 [Sesbania bispinosa]|nr:Cytochrome P450 [Sesbania bispinosa]